MSEYTPTFAISFVSTLTGNGIIDAGTSDKKTAKGAAKFWIKNVGHVISSFLMENKEEYIKVILRPIESRIDAVSFNMSGAYISAERYIVREARHGSTVFDYDELFETYNA